MNASQCLPIAAAYPFNVARPCSSRSHGALWTSPASPYRLLYRAQFPSPARALWPNSEEYFGLHLGSFGTPCSAPLVGNVVSVLHRTDGLPYLFRRALFG